VGGLRVVGIALGEGLMRVGQFVSVVVPTRDRAALVGDALRSLLTQDYPIDRYEILIVDDGSTDETVSMARLVSNTVTQPRVRILQQARSNQNTARNRGISESTGSSIAFFDDDEIAPPGWLAALVGASRRFPEAACVGGAYRLRFEGRQPRLCSRCWPGEGAFDLGEPERYVDDVAAGNMIVRRDAFDRVGVFDESLRGHGDETEWMLRLTANDLRVLYTPAAWVWHRRTDQQMRMTRRLRKAFDAGQQQARFLSKVGRSAGPAYRIGHVPRLLAHSVRRTCTGGLLQATTAVGCSIERGIRTVA
jgi:glycosyltransferase involved in cell wall biosynthesis